MNINIRPCSITDLDKLQSIGHETYDQTFRTMNSQETMDKYLQESFNNKKHVVYQPVKGALALIKISPAKTKYLELRFFADTVDICLLRKAPEKF